MKFSILMCFTNFIITFYLKNVSSLEAESIVGGKIARTGQFNYMVSLQANKYHFCGGSIISERHVLTAAHCIIKKGIIFNLDYEWTVLVGSIKAMTKDQNILRIKVKKSYVPKEFIKTTLKPDFRETGDIAVLYLEKSLETEVRGLKILNLPTVELSYRNQHPTVTGYGHEEVRLEKNPLNNQIKEVTIEGDYKLKYAETTVLTNDECKPKQRYVIHPSHLCAQTKQRDPDKPEGLCVADSGGPLVLNSNTVIGVVSYSPSACDETFTPAIYTRVTSYLTFLNKAKNNVYSPDIRVHVY